MKTSAGSFQEIIAGLGIGTPLPLGWTAVSALESLVLAGLTGVGKSTVLEQLTGALGDVRVLPDRRTLTDLLMIPYVQRTNGRPVEPVRDRAERFELTRRYREEFVGGMAYALSTLSLAPDTASGLVVFDGLRGANEVRYAAELMPQARFLMLDAPDVVRIRRLVSRQDAFDAVGRADGLGMVNGGDREASSLAALGVPELAQILDDDEQAEVASWVRGGEVSLEELAGKARIVLAERRNYDPVATRRALDEAAPTRTMIVDTSVLSPEEIAARVVHWLRP